MTISIRFALVAASALLLFSAAPGSAQDKIKIATEGAYPPFNSYGPDGKLMGFDVDIADALCAQMKADCELVAQDWDGMIPALQSNKFDAIIASMSITEERKQQVSFTDKYYTTPLSVIALKDSDLASTEAAAMAGKSVGAQAGTTQAVYSEDVYAKAGADVKLYPTHDEAAADLSNGRLDAVVSDKFVLVEWMKTSGKDCCKMVGDIKGTETEAGIAIRKEDNALREKFNAAIAAIIADGTYSKIVSKYFDFDIHGG